MKMLFASLLYLVFAAAIVDGKLSTPRRIDASAAATKQDDDEMFGYRFYAGIPPWLGLSELPGSIGLTDHNGTSLWWVNKPETLMDGSVVDSAVAHVVWYHSQYHYSQYDPELEQGFSVNDWEVMGYASTINPASGGQYYDSVFADFADSTVYRFQESFDSDGGDDAHIMKLLTWETTQGGDQTDGFVAILPIQRVVTLDDPRVQHMLKAAKVDELTQESFDIVYKKVFALWHTEDEQVTAEEEASLTSADQEEEVDANLPEKMQEKSEREKIKKTQKGGSRM